MKWIKEKIEDCSNWTMYQWRTIKSFFKKLKRFIQFAPHIWRGYDWDYQYAIDLFAYQLERTAKALEDDNAYGMNSSHNAARIRLALKLMDIVYHERYVDQVWDEMEAEFGSCKTTWESVPNSDNSIFTGFKWERAIDDADNQRIGQLLSDKMSEAHLKTQKAHKLLWRVVEHNIQKWWD